MRDTHEQNVDRNKHDGGRGEYRQQHPTADRPHRPDECRWTVMLRAPCARVALLSE
jgi:hypothetical protein